MLLEHIDEFDETEETPPYFLQSRVALLKGELNDAVRLWREGARSGEGYAIMHMADQYPWQKTFPKYYEQPAYGEMLMEFGLDPLSRSKIKVPELPF